MNRLDVFNGDNIVFTRSGQQGNSWLYTEVTIFVKNTVSYLCEIETRLRAILCKNQTKWEMKNFEHPTQIYMVVGPHEGCSKMPITEVIT